MVVISGPFHPNLPWAPTRFTAPYREKKDLFIFCPPWAATKSCAAIRGGGIVTRAFLLLRPNFAISLTRGSGSGFLFWTIPPRLHWLFSVVADLYSETAISTRESGRAACRERVCQDV